MLPSPRFPRDLFRRMPQPSQVSRRGLFSKRSVRLSSKPCTGGILDVDLELELDEVSNPVRVARFDRTTTINSTTISTTVVVSHAAYQTSFDLTAVEVSFFSSHLRTRYNKESTKNVLSFREINPRPRIGPGPPLRRGIVYGERGFVGNHAVQPATVQWDEGMQLIHQPFFVYQVYSKL